MTDRRLIPRFGRPSAALLIACACAALIPTQPAAQTPAPSKVSPAPVPAMNGAWDYNDKLSVDASTGRPEQAPLSATQGRRNSGSSGGSGSSPAPGGGMSGSMDDFERNVMALFMSERRALVRDLLEVPELLRISVTSEGVTFVDDLKRERTYLTNGKTRKYQLGAAQFEARAYWADGRFHKEIEGSNGFRMRETYFLAEEGQRLMVVVRVGDSRKPDAQFGVNRVFDRVKSQSY